MTNLDLWRQMPIDDIIEIILEGMCGCLMEHICIQSTIKMGTNDEFCPRDEDCRQCVRLWLQGPAAPEGWKTMLKEVP